MRCNHNLTLRKSNWKIENRKTSGKTVVYLPTDLKYIFHETTGLLLHAAHGDDGQIECPPSNFIYLLFRAFQYGILTNRCVTECWRRVIAYATRTTFIATSQRKISKSLSLTRFCHILLLPPPSLRSPNNNRIGIYCRRRKFASRCSSSDCETFVDDDIVGNGPCACWEIPPTAIGSRRATSNAISSFNCCIRLSTSFDDNSICVVSNLVALSCCCCWCCSMRLIFCTISCISFRFNSIDGPPLSSLFSWSTIGVKRALNIW